MKKLLSALVAVVVLGACEKKIDISLDDATEQTVVESLLRAGDTAVSIRISKTANYFNAAAPKTVSGAGVQFTDAAGLVHVAVEKEPGLYVAEGITSTVDGNYSLQIDENGKITNGNSYMPKPIAIDSVSYEFLDGGDFFDDTYLMSFHYQDPPNESNFYRILITKNDTLEESIILSSDKFSDGQYTDETLFLDNVQLGDYIEFEMWSISEDLHNYYSTLVDALNVGGVAPGNPLTNLEGDAQLGYFGTYSYTGITDTVGGGK